MPSKIYEAPAGTFKVRYDAHFGAVISGQRVAVHLWNTQRPVLEARLTLAALALFPEIYENEATDDFAVLSLRNSQLIRLGKRPEMVILATNMIDALEGIFLDIRSEASSAKGTRRPMSPPPV